MLKKILLMSVFCIFAVPEKAYSLDDKATVAAVTIGAGALGTIIYWANRESNDCLIARAKLLIEQNKQLCNQVEKYISQNCNSSSLEELQNDLNSFQVKLLALNNQLDVIYLSLNGRYNSLLSPWNWSDKMFQAFNEIKLSLELNKLTNISIQGLLSKVNYLYCLKKYKNTLESIHVFIVENKNIWQEKTSFFASINSLQQLCNSEEAIKITKQELDLFLLEYKDLDAQLKQVLYSLNIQDRNSNIETDFNVFGQQIEFLSNLLVQHSKFLNMHLKYRKCIMNIDSEHLLVKEARKIIGGSSYPLRDFINQLDLEINYLNNIHTKVALYKETVLDSLVDIRSTLIASNEHIIELRAYENYLEQKRQAEAAFRAARAAEEAANAASRQAQTAQEAADIARRQARAAEEQNRLKKEQNRIEQERNDLERRKQQEARDNNNNNRW